MKKMYLLIATFLVTVISSTAQFANNSLSNLTVPISINHTLTPRLTSGDNIGPAKKNGRIFFFLIKNSDILLVFLH